VTAARLLFDTLRFHGGPPPDALAAAWVQADGRGLPALIAFEGCASWLYRRLRRLGVLEQIDRRLADWLTSVMREETARNLLIDAETDALAGVLQRIEIPAVFTKGVARRLAAERYPLADARSTNDVDLLVPAGRAWDVWHELRRLGYERTKLTKPPRPEHHHLPALYCDRRVGVEIHTTHAQGISPDESWRRLFEYGMDVERGALTYRVPSATELLWNGTAHALRIPDMAFLLVRFLDAAVIWASGAAVDWQTVARRLDAKEIVDSGAASAWLGAAAALTGALLPPELAGRTAAYDLPRQLELRFTVLRRMAVPPSWRKLLAWWTTDQVRRAS
jgi:putative nucleotidyltransferase-like protein